MVSKKLFYRWLLLITLVTSPLFAGSLTLSPSFDSVMHYVYLQNYEYAQLWVSECSTITLEDSLFYSLMIDNARMVDYESYTLDGAEFVEKAYSLIPTLLEKSDTIPRYTYYTSALLGSIGLARVKQGEFVGGANASRQSVRILRGIVQEHVDFLPAYLGIGLYTYYLATSLNWLPFTSSSRDDGIELVFRSISANHTLLYSALQSLFWVLLDEERYDEADEVARRFLAAYPDNTLMLRGRMILASRMEQYDIAEQLAVLLQTRASHRVPVNWSDFYSAGRYRVVALRHQGREYDAKVLVDSLVSVEIPAQVMEITWVRKHVKALVSIQKELE